MKLPLSFQILRSTLSLSSYLAPRPVGNFYAGKFMTPHRRRRTAWEVELLRTAQFSATFNSCRYWEWGSGPTILLLHGWEGRASQLGRFVEPLVRSGFRVIAWDGPAHGDSKGKITNLLASARALNEFAERQGGLYGVIAHSFGGRVATVAMSEQMEKPLKLERLVQISSPYSVQGVFDRFTSFMRLSPTAAKAFQSSVESATGVSALAVDQLRPLPATLVVHSTDDFEVPFEDSERLVAENKSASLLTLKGLGHRRILRDATVINSCRDFLYHGISGLGEPYKHP